MGLYFKLQPTQNSKKKKGSKDLDYVVLCYKNDKMETKFSTSIKVQKKDFGGGEGYSPILRTEPNYGDYNEFLRDFKLGIEKIISRIVNEEKKEPTTEMVNYQYQKFKREKKFHSQIPSQNLSPSVIDVIEEYLSHIDKNSGGRKLNPTDKDTPYSKSVRSRFVHIKEFIQKEYKNQLEFYEVLDEFFGKLQTYLISKELSNSTISKIISQFRQFVVWCKKNRKTEYGDTSYRVSLPLNYKVVVTLKKDEISKLFEFNDFNYLDEKGKVNPKSTEFYHRYKEKDYLLNVETKSGEIRTFTLYEVIKDIFLFGVSTGLRWSNLCLIKGDDKDYDEKEFTPIQIKTSQQVQIVENYISKKIWMKYVDGISSKQYLFPLPIDKDRNGKKVREDQSRRNYNTKGNVHLKKILQIVGLNRKVDDIKMVGKITTKQKFNLYEVIGFHNSRKSFSTILNESGVDMYSVQNQLGHSNGGSMTSRYISVNKDKLKGVFDFVKNEEVKVVKEMTKEERLIELKGLYKKKLLTKDVYEGLVRDLLK
jgi:integrase